MISGDVSGSVLAAVDGLDVGTRFLPSQSRLPGDSKNHGGPPVSATSLQSRL